MATIKALFNPQEIGSLTLPNRIGMSAMTRNRAEGTFPNDLMKEYYLQYLQRTVGGAGLIVSEGLLITRQGTEWPHAPGIWDEKHVVGWKDITDAIHEAGGKIYAQLWHVGRIAHPDTPEQKLAGTPVYAPSTISARGGKFRHISGEPGNATPTAIDNPWTIVEQYKQGAVNAKAAGFDGVEVHRASGYLIQQFLDNTSNHRNDMWGGSVENRCRFGLEVLKALIDVFGSEVAIKLSPAGGYNDVGMPLQDTLDTFSNFITEADKLKLSYITLVRFIPVFDFFFDGVSRSTKHDVLDSHAHLIKNAKVFINSGVTPEEGEELVSSEKVDGIFIGMGWITHPDLVKRVENGTPLSNAPNFRGIHGSGPIGYTDYPVAEY